MKAETLNSRPRSPRDVTYILELHYAWWERRMRDNGKEDAVGCEITYDIYIYIYHYYTIIIYRQRKCRIVATSVGLAHARPNYGYIVKEAPGVQIRHVRRRHAMRHAPIPLASYAARACCGTGPTSRPTVGTVDVGRDTAANTRYQS